jgi:hypothetical protein
MSFEQTAFNFDIKSGVEGWFNLQVLSAAGEVVRETGWFKNLITNQGLDRIGQAQDWLKFCQVGTGNTTPANTDTALVTYTAGVVATSAVRAAAGSPDYYAYTTNTYVYTLGAVVGNMAEVGIGWATSGSTLFSRALIVDGGGFPTTLPVLVTEQLQVIYQFRVYPPLTDSTGNVTISGTVYNYTIRAAMIGTYSNLTGGSDYGWGGFNTSGDFARRAATLLVYGATTGLAANTSRPTLVYAGTGGGITRTDAAYTTGTYYRDLTFFASSTDWNGSGNPQTIYIGWTLGAYQVEFSPTFAKTSLNSLTLVFRQSWTRR